MKLGDVLRLVLTRVPSDVSGRDLRAALEKYGTVKALEIRKGEAQVDLLWNGSKLIDSSGMGEIPMNGTVLPVKLSRPPGDIKKPFGN